ncbi:phytoene/squalene synthase family protein [Haloarchaeobius sp. HME9146]|uniref:phytoene/squalene synthase family protein n=1 Tax=Haloarchaeobius sp. HME9146 TaxID=2978732 RepID=UPI0021C05CE9|nr:phytoene/squalene synthase family protein [Haloarchaeobius sp. HME9146]MCT9096190.1 squalene/phytoene synthase family protein [Haloarchaeobius sp. HME9146]
MNEEQAAYPVDDDLAWCYDAVQGVSRTFAITIEELEEPTARHICLGYLLCRVADTVEDAGHIPPAEKAELLRMYADVLDEEDPTTAVDFREQVDPWIPDELNDDWKVVAESPRVVETYRKLSPEAREDILPPVLELTNGMAEFVERHADSGGLRIQTLDELEEYCWYVAGTVGSLVTGLVTRGTSESRESRLWDNARSFGLLLQLVNVAKDVSDDYQEENNVYLPAEWLAEEGVDRDNVLDPENEEEVATVIERVVDHASGYLDDTQTYLEALPEHRGNRLSAWGIPYLLAVATLRELRKRPRDVVREGGVKISRMEVIAIIGWFRQHGDRQALEQVRNIIENKPLHEADVSV